MTWDTVNVLTPWAGEIAWKLVGKILNVLEVYRVDKCWVHCPFPCNVPAMYQLSTPPLAPSVSMILNLSMLRISLLMNSTAPTVLMVLLR